MTAVAENKLAKFIHSVLKEGITESAYEDMAEWLYLEFGNDIPPSVSSVLNKVTAKNGKMRA